MEQTKLLDAPKSRWSISRLGIFLAGFIVGFGVYWLIFDIPRSGESDILKEEKAEGASTQGNQEAGALTEDQRIARGENVLVAGNQPARMAATLSMVLLSQNGWVAIHDVMSDGSWGPILGARRFDAGKYFNEHIELLRMTEEGARYAAVLHADDGNSAFEHEREVPLRDEHGEGIAAEFVATVPADE